MEVGTPTSLSSSTEAALRFAQASARQRVGEEATVDALDLVFGILLAHPGSSPPERLLRHFELTLGDVKPDDRLTASPDQLNATLRDLEPGSEPDFDTEASEALQHAGRHRGDDGDVHLRHLWGGILAGSSGPFITRMAQALARRRTSLEAVRQVTEEWLADGRRHGEPRYTELLQERLPYSPRPVAVARYNHDASGGGERDGSAPTTDLLGLADEVDAFAYLLASVDLRPPLAIGLFGDWGSGKSFFMESVKARVRAVTRDPSVAGVDQAEARFWKEIVQIDFNAWHYSETDLLASLVNHLFTELERQTAIDGPEARGDADGWVRQLTKVTQEEEAALAEVERLSLKLSDARAEVAKADAAARAEVTRAEQAAVDAVRAKAEAAIRPVLGSVRLGATTAADLVAEIGRAKRELRRTDQYRSALFGSGWRTAASAGAIVLIPVLVWVLSWTQSLAHGALVGLYAVIGEAGLALAAANRWVGKRNDELDAARAEAEAAVAAARARATEQVHGLQADVQALEHDLAAARQEVAAAADKRRAVEERLNEPTHRVIQRFLRERLEEGTYRQRLGLHAVVRSDLDRLSSYIRAINAEELDGSRRHDHRAGSTERSPADRNRLFNRIILYIDDLDRCPDDKVIEVLQAVHLLLAFDLFVVVVAVDDRWLSHALEAQYPVLAQRPGSVQDGPAPDGAVDAVPAFDAPGPSDYLEKIFQIPFRVRSLGPDGRRQMIDGLLRRQVEPSGEAGPGRRPGRYVRLVGPAEVRVIESMVQTGSRTVTSAAEELTLTTDEFTLLHHLAPLLGPTPRSVKRFANVYQLLKMMDPARPGPSPADYQLTALVLAVHEGRPDLVEAVRDLGERSLGEVPEFAPLCRALPQWGGVTGKRLREVEPSVRRFQFP